MHILDENINANATEVHARAHVRLNIHENANARTVGPISELLVVGMLFLDSIRGS